MLIPNNEITLQALENKLTYSELVEVLRTTGIDFFDVDSSLYTSSNTLSILPLSESAIPDMGVQAWEKISTNRRRKTKEGSKHLQYHR